MFEIGDYVAHYKQGICEVVSIGKLDISCSDSDKEYYTLKPIYDAGGTVYTPVDNTRHQIRRILTKEEASELLDHIQEIEVLNVKSEKLREATYKESLLKNECKDWIALLKTSYTRKMKRLASGKKSINVDERYMNSAESFLYGELAVVLGMKREEIKKQILGCLRQEIVCE